jgi:ribosomal protein S18 acetylase RimI-like enzyme
MSSDIRHLAVSDLQAIAEVHCDAFPDGGLTSLGAEAVRRYYLWQLTGPHEALALGAFRDARLGGFCFGGLFRGAMTGYLRRNRLYLAARMLTHPWLLTSPLVRDRVRQARRLLRSAPPGAPSGGAGAGERSFGILSIAVHPAFRKHGLGRQLMLEMERHALERGFTRMNLSVEPANAGAVAFYERLGWVRVPVDRWDGTMIRSLAS